MEGAFKIWWALPTLEISGGEGRQIIEVVWMINDIQNEIGCDFKVVYHMSVAVVKVGYVRINDNLMISDNLN